MISTNLYLFAKKIHRFLVILISTIGILMAGTGTFLKFIIISEKLSFVDMEQIRLIHNNLSPYFAVVFLGMLITGLIMYFFPMLRNK